MLPALVDSSNKLIIESEQMSFSALMPEQTTHSNVLKSVLTQVELINNKWQLTLNVDGQTLFGLVSRRVWDKNDFKVGNVLYTTIHNLE